MSSSSAKSTTTVKKAGGGRGAGDEEDLPPPIPTASSTTRATSTAAAMEIADGNPLPLAAEITPPLKRLTKQEKKFARYEATKKYNKEKDAKKRAAKLAAFKELVPFAHKPSDEERVLKRQAANKLKAEEDEALKTRLAWAQEHGLKVCIDFGFDHEHTERETRSLAKQISLTWSLVRKVIFRICVNNGRVTQ